MRTSKPLNSESHKLYVFKTTDRPWYALNALERERASYTCLKRQTGVATP